MKTYLAHVALLIVGLTYAGNYLVAKGLMPDLIGPSGLLSCASLAVGACFGFFGVRCMQEGSHGTELMQRIGGAYLLAARRE